MIYHDLPKDWQWLAIGELGEVRLGRQRSPQHHVGEHMRPYLRVANVMDDRLDLDDVKRMNFTPSEFEIYKLNPGDVLLNEGQSLELVGRAALYRGEVPGCCFQNTLIRFRCSPAIVPGFALLAFRWALHTGRFQSIAKWTTNIAHLGAQRLTEFKIPLPPVNIQERLVGETARQFSHLDSAIASLRRAKRNLFLHSASMLATATRGGKVVELGDVSGLASYGTSVKCVDERLGPPVVRIPNVVRGRLSLADLKYATEPLPKSGALMPGDLLVIRTNGSRSLIGRAALVESEFDTPHFYASYLIRFRLTVDEPLRRWISLMWNSPLVRLHLEAAAATSAGQYNLNIDTLRHTRLALPGVDVKQALQALGKGIGGNHEIEKAIDANLLRAERLRKAILNRTLQGQSICEPEIDYV